MGILQMSLSASLLILSVVVIRALFMHKLPKKTFLALWGVVLCRLLIPFTIPSRFSIYTLLNWSAAGQRTTGTAVSDGMSFFTAPASEQIPAFPTLPFAPNTGASGEAVADYLTSGTILTLVWLVGAAACALFFLVTYLRCRREFQASLPVHNSFIDRWLREAPIRRPLHIRQSDKITAPLTYGILKPVVLLPKSTDWTDDVQLKYVLTHEFVHIRHFDTLTKMMLAAALSIHWFNPLVWVVYVLANRDLELSCDETVVRTFGETTKASYARMLIGMEERKSRLLDPLCSNFSKNSIEERIVSIMKMKKTSLMGIMLALALVAGTITVFATSETSAKADLQGDYVTTDEPAKRKFIGPTESKQVINVDVKSLDSGEFECLGQYTLEEGDIIAYNITGEGNGNLNVEFRKTADPNDDKGYLGHSGYAGNSIGSSTKDFDSFNSFKVNNSLAGTYYLWVGNYDGETLSNIKGTVEILVECAF